MVISVKKNYGIFWFLLIMLDFPLPAQAEVEDGTHIDPAIIEPLMKWVETQLGTKVPVLPQVIASRSRFDSILERMNRRFAGRPQALYIPGTVYIDSDAWDPEDPTQISLLVHELVHHAQYFMATSLWPCKNAKEKQAYALQNEWLEQRGDSPFVNIAWIERVSSCPDTGTLLLAQN